MLPEQLALALFLVILNSSNSSSQASIGGSQNLRLFAKISNDGDWEWVYSHGQYYNGEVAAIDIDSNDNVRIGFIFKWQWSLL